MIRYLVAVVFLLAGSGWALADENIGGYFTYLSTIDHYNSQGTPLTSAGTIIAQDRANYHRFKTPDNLDESDNYFTTVERRLLVEEMLDRGGVSAQVRSDIVNFQMTAFIEIWTGAKGPYLKVTLLP